ncbi:MAG TPA: hypothetical protein VN457_03245 [Chlamydiales bacterium]|nr:hypothetical protein [Chlamydiales bacterium]
MPTLAEVGEAAKEWGLGFLKVGVGIVGVAIAIPVGVIASCGFSQAYAYFSGRKVQQKIDEQPECMRAWQQDLSKETVSFEATVKSLNLSQRVIALLKGEHPATSIFQKTIPTPSTPSSQLQPQGKTLPTVDKEDPSHGYEANIVKEILRLNHELRGQLARITLLNNNIASAPQKLENLQNELFAKNLGYIPVVGAFATTIAQFGLAGVGSTAVSGQSIAGIDALSGGSIGKKLQSSILFPGNDSAQSQDPEYRAGLDSWAHAKKFVLVKNQDGTTRHIEALHLRGTDPRTRTELPDNARTVVLYHGNGMNAYEMLDRAAELQKAGFNVYIPTMGGKNYAQTRGNDESNNTHETNELSMYADVDADMEFLRGLGVKQVTPDGLSIGGTKAFQMAKKYGANYDERDKNPPYPRCFGIIPEETLASSEKVMQNAAHNIAGLQALGAQMGDIALPQGEDRVNGNQTDGLDNIGKAQALNGKVKMLAIRATQDILMGKGNKDKDGNFESDFAYDFAEAVLGKDKAKENVVSLAGGHCAPWTEDPAAKKRVIDFLNATMPRENDPPALS